MKLKLPFYITALLLCTFVFTGGDSFDAANENEPSVNQADTIRPSDFPYPTKWNWYYAGIPGVNTETVGCVKFQGKYIINRWDNATLYRINDDGPNGGPGTIADSNNSYAGQIRDMTIAPDGSGTEFLWGGRASTTLYKMDAMGNTVKTFVHSGAAYRIIAWDKNRKGFWSSDFSGNIVCRDTNGTTLKTVTTALSGKYGLAWDSTSSADSAFLWVWSQGTGTCLLTKIHIASGSTRATYIFQLPSTLGIAGAAEIQVVNSELLMILNYQEFAVVAYKMNIATGVTNNISGADSYRLGQNYPNPFNPSTKISFSLPSAANVRLTVYDVLGKELAVILNEKREAGDHSVDFHAIGLQSGIYFYKIESGNFSETRKMMMIK